MSARKGNYRILITSDIHYTDLGTWYGVDNETRLQLWVKMYR